jgi:hypothetical protein
VFSGLALFNQLTVPLFIFPITVPIIISAMVSPDDSPQYTGCLFYVLFFMVQAPVTTHIVCVPLNSISFITVMFSELCVPSLYVISVHQSVYLSTCMFHL